MSDVDSQRSSGTEDGGTPGEAPGEAPQPPPKTSIGAELVVAKRKPWSRKGALALVVLIGSAISVSVIGIQRLAGAGKKTPEENGKPMHDRPAAAAAEPRRLELPALPFSAASATPGAGTIRVPALVPATDEMPAIPVRRAGESAPTAGGGVAVPPEDAPVLLVSARATGGSSTRTGAAPGAPDAPGSSEPPATEPRDALAATSRNLQVYQQQLQGMLENLTRTTGSAPEAMPPAPAAMLSGAATPAPVGLFGGQLPGSATPRTQAASLRQRSLTLPKGTAFTCALKTRVISATSGLVGCVVQRDIYGDDGRVLLIERGSHLDGEYRVTSVRPGTVRIPVLWTRVRTPLGVVVDIESPGTGALGESGIDGHVDNRWSERVGAAMLLSLIDDAVKISLQSQGGEHQGDTLVLPSTTSNTSKLAEKVLDSTINIPPLIYQYQGAVVGIYVARDVDFSAVYQLVPEGSQP